MALESYIRDAIGSTLLPSTMIPQHAWLPEDVLSADISCAVFSCNSHLIYVSFCDGNIGVFWTYLLRPRCRIAPSVYLSQPINSCGRLPVLKTSWTDHNPGRRFWGCCLLSKTGWRGYNFNVWFNPVMCPRAKAIILGLLRKSSKLERELLWKAKSKRFAWMCAFVCLIALVVGVILKTLLSNKTGEEDGQMLDLNQV